MSGSKRIFGNIMNIQHCSVDDGPGIRTTVFLKGCPLTCAWCHNPESHNTHPEVMYRADKCVLCKECLSACHNNAHLFTDIHIVNRNACTRCGECIASCVFGALELVGKEMTVEEILPELLLDSVFYKRSGGGITVSGGEPLMQWQFTTELLAECKKEHLHTCVETCGFAPADHLLQIKKYTDLFLFDYKLTDPEKHKKFTGVSNSVILENLSILFQSGADMILRCPMIPDINIETSHFNGIIQLANKYSNIREIHLEPYHPLGISKAKALGKVPSYTRSDFLNKKDLVEVQDYIQNNVSVKVKIL